MATFVDAFRAADPVAQAFVATLGTYALTAIGTLPVFLSAAHRAA